MVEKKTLTDNDKSEDRKKAEAEGAKKPKIAKDPKVKKKTSKISDTRHGAVIVISFANCLKLGFNKDTTTREVTELVYKKLGL